MFKLNLYNILQKKTKGRYFILDSNVQWKPSIHSTSRENIETQLSSYFKLKMIKTICPYAVRMVHLTHQMNNQHNLKAVGTNSIIFLRT